MTMRVVVVVTTFYERRELFMKMSYIYIYILFIQFFGCKRSRVRFPERHASLCSFFFVVAVAVADSRIVFCLLVIFVLPFLPYKPRFTRPGNIVESSFELAAIAFWSFDPGGS